MSEQDIKGVNKDNGNPDNSSPIVEKPQEVVELEAKKAELEEQVAGLAGTVESLKEDIVRKRQERKGVNDEEQQPVIDKEALLAELEERNKSILEAELKPIIEENEKLRKAVLKSNEEALKAKKAALDSLNARIASATAAKTSVANNSAEENEVELSDAEKKVAQELGLKNPRYLKDVELG